MKRNELEKYLGKKVMIKLYDGEILFGELHKTGEELFKHEPNLYIPKDRYFLTPKCQYLFKSSHVVKVKEKELEEL